MLLDMNHRRKPDDGGFENPVLPAEDPRLALFDKWAEDAAKTPEEVAQEQQMWEEFERGVNQTRRELGMKEL